MVICCDFDAAGNDKYEWVARVLAEYGVTFHTESGRSMALVQAVNGTPLGTTIREALRGNTGHPVFYFGHGRRRPPALLGRDETVLLARKDWPLLRGRVVCALACYSADAVGKELRKFGASVLGYSGWAWVIYEEPGASLLRPAALAAPKALLGGATLKEAQAAARLAYEELAARLNESEDMGLRALAGFVVDNARAITISGNRRRRLEWPS
jgi:hypothetical protein